MGYAEAQGSNIRDLLPIYLFTMFWIVSWSLSVIGPIMPLYMRSLGVGVMEWGILAMSHSIGMVISEWFWGMLSDRADRRIFIAISLVGMSVIFPLYTFKILRPYFIVLQFVMGALAVINAPNTRALISDRSSKESIGMSMSLWGAVMTLGVMVGSMTGSYIAQIWSFERTFHLSSIISIGGGLTVLGTLQRGELRGQKVIRKDFEIREGFKTLIHSAPVRILFSVAVVTWMARATTFSFLPLFASENISMSILEVGALSSVMSLTQLITTPIFGKLSERFTRRRLLIFGFSLSSIMLLCFFFVETPPQLFLVSIGTSIGISASPLLLAFLYEATPDNLRGLSMGLYGSFEGIGSMIGPPVYGFIWSVFAPHWVFVVGAILQFMSIMLVHLIKVEPETNVSKRIGK